MAQAGQHPLQKELKEIAVFDNHSSSTVFSFFFEDVSR